MVISVGHTETHRLKSWAPKMENELGPSPDRNFWARPSPRPPLQWVLCCPLSAGQLCKGGENKPEAESLHRLVDRLRPCLFRWLLWRRRRGKLLGRCRLLRWLQEREESILQDKVHRSSDPARTITMFGRDFVARDAVLLERIRRERRTEAAAAKYAAAADNDHICSRVRNDSCPGVTGRKSYLLYCIANC